MKRQFLKWYVINKCQRQQNIHRHDPTLSSSDICGMDINEENINEDFKYIIRLDIKPSGRKGLKTGGYSDRIILI